MQVILLLEFHKSKVSQNKVTSNTGYGLRTKLNENSLKGCTRRGSKKKKIKTQIAYSDEAAECLVLTLLIQYFTE